MANKTNIFDIMKGKGGDRLGTLSAMFVKILNERGVTPSSWNRLMETYLMLPVHGSGDDTKKAATIRSNMNQSLAEKNMTIKVFLKGLTFLRPERITFVLKLQFGDDHFIERWRGVETTTEIIAPLTYTGKEGPGLLGEWYQRVEGPLMITEEERRQLTDLYLDNPRSGASKDRELRSNQKGNVLKKMHDKKKSWGSFNQCLMVLAPEDVVFDVRLLWRITYMETEHKISYSPIIRKRQGTENAS